MQVDRVDLLQLRRPRRVIRRRARNSERRQSEERQRLRVALALDDEGAVLDLADVFQAILTVHQQLAGRAVAPLEPRRRSLRITLTEDLRLAALGIIRYANIRRAVLVLAVREPVVLHEPIERKPLRRGVVADRVGVRLHRDTVAFEYLLIRRLRVHVVELRPIRHEVALLAAAEARVFPCRQIHAEARIFVPVKRAASEEVRAGDFRFFDGAFVFGAIIDDVIEVRICIHPLLLLSGRAARRSPPVFSSIIRTAVRQRPQGRSGTRRHPERRPL